MASQKCQPSVPSGHGIIRYVRDDLELRVFQPGHEGVFDLIGKGPRGAILTRFRHDILADRPALTVECRFIAMIAGGWDLAREFIEAANRVLPFGAWLLDDDGEVYFRAQTLLCASDWESQVDFFLTAPLRLSQQMQIDLDRAGFRFDEASAEASAVAPKASSVSLN